MFQMSSFHFYISRILSFVAGSCIKFGLNCSFYLLLSLLEIVQQQQNNQATFVAIIHILCGKILKSNMNHSTLIHQESIYCGNYHTFLLILKLVVPNYFLFRELAVNRWAKLSYKQDVFLLRIIGTGLVLEPYLATQSSSIYCSPSSCPLSTVSYFFSKKKNSHHQFLEKAMLIDGTTMKK